jgi:hypothetical protein
MKSLRQGLYGRLLYIKKRPGYEGEARLRMDHRMSRIDRAKAERERLCAEAVEHRTQADQHLASASELEAKAQELEIFIRLWEQLGEGEAENGAEARQSEMIPDEEIGPTSPFYGMGQPGAVTLLLKMEGRNMTTGDVTQGLRQRGFEFATKDPVRAVDWALKRAAEQGHVIKLNKNLWVASPNADPSALETNARSARTMAGLKVAQRRGVRLGAPPKITEEHRRLAVSFFEQGATISEIARRCGVSTVTLSRHIEEWRGEGRFPAPRPKGRKKKAEPEDRDRGMVH